MRAAERDERAAKALALFVGGATYRQIAAALPGISTGGAAHKIVQKALADSAQRRALLSDEALAIHQERQERLLLAHWPQATRTEEPDHRSAELCRRILAQQARLYGLDAEPVNTLPAPTSNQGVGGDEDEEPADELDRLRRARSTGTE